MVGLRSIGGWFSDRVVSKVGLYFHRVHLLCMTLYDSMFVMEECRRAMACTLIFAVGPVAIGK